MLSLRGRPLALMLVVAALLAAGAGLLWLRAPSTGEASARAATPSPEVEPPPATPSVVEPSAPARRRLYLEVLSADHAPVGGARVRAVSPLGAREAITDGSGLAILDDVPAVLSRLEASATGYAPEAFVAPRLPDAEEASWTFTLAPDDESAGRLKGAVLASGAPVEGAVVLLPGPDEDARLEPRRVAVTDETGRFVADLPARHVARIIAAHVESGVGEAHPEDAEEVTVELPPGGFLEGTVVRAGEGAVGRFELRVDAGGSADVLRRALGAFWRLPREQRRDPDVRARRMAVTRLLRPRLSRFDEEAGGRFRVGPLPPGSATLTAVARGAQPASVEAVVPSGETRDGLVLRLTPPLVVVGRVTDASTSAPLVGATVTAEGAGSVEMPGFASAITDADGWFRLETTSGARHSLSVSARGYLPFDVGGVEGRAGEELRRDVALRKASADERRAREYVGVGATLRPHEDGARIESVFEGGSAAEHLGPGDIVLRVDGVWVKGMPLREIVQRIVGEPGTEVELLIRRAGQSHGERVTLQRRRISTSG